MPKLSAGLLVYRCRPSGVELLLVHPGGPFWAKKDTATWSVPKGLADEGESLFAAAQREFTEETGFMPPQVKSIDLGYVTYGNKKVFIWAVEGDFNADAMTSATTTIEWPPKSGNQQTFAECDKAGWFNAAAARQKLVKGQVPLVDRLLDHVR
jgi:predicted NUDIX family NTP pyrophosphohydrolase